MNREEASLFFRLGVVPCSPVPPNKAMQADRRFAAAADRQDVINLIAADTMQRHQILAAFISIVGVAGESYVLWHSLVNMYPFKMLTYPSAQFFAAVANGVSPTLFAAFAVAVVLWSRRSPIATPVLSTIVFPVVFAVAVALVTVASQGIEVPATVRNFDGYTIIEALWEFASTALYLSGMALVLGGVSSGLVALIRPRQVAGG